MSIGEHGFPSSRIRQLLIAATTSTRVVIRTHHTPNQLLICRIGFKNLESANTITFEFGITNGTHDLPLNTKSAVAAGVVSSDIGEFVLERDEELYVIATSSSGSMKALVCGTCKLIPLERELV